MTDDSAGTVSDFGERELIRRITSRTGAPPPGEIWGGDDTAVVAVGGTLLLLTTDVLVEGIDFDRSYATGADVGFKALASNASDIAAMGGRPGHALVSLVMPFDTTTEYLDDLVGGLVEAGSRWGIGIAGGDISEGSEIAVSVALTGVPAGPRPVLRSGARPGDAICVTGSLGGARAGLEVLRSRMALDSDDLRALVARQLRPRARVAEGIRLAELEPTAMIDVSDGLAIDLGHIVEASGVGCEVAEDEIPADPGIAAVGMESIPTAILGGEDFELLVTIDPAKVDEARAAVGSLGTPLGVIGEATDGPANIGPRSLSDWREEGWEHLRNR